MSRYRLVVLLALPLFMISTLVRAADKENKIPDELQTILEKADKFELLSLSPEHVQEKPKDGFHGWRVLGKTAVTEADARKNLVAAFKKGVADNKGIAAACFNPRHGIRATHDGKSVDFVICFECYQVQTYVGDKREKGFLIADSPASTFDAVLKEAKVPLAEKAKKE